MKTFLINCASAAILSLIFKSVFPRYWWIATLLSFVVIDFIYITVKKGSPKFFSACRKYPALAMWYFTKHPDCFCAFYPGQIPTLDKCWSGPYKLFIPKGNTYDEMCFFTKEPECEKFENEFALIADDLAKCMNKVWTFVVNHKLIDDDPDFVASEGDKMLSLMYDDCLKAKGLKPNDIKPTIPQGDTEISFTPEQVAHLIKRLGIVMLDDDLLNKYPQLAKGHEANGCPCLCSAALWCLYCLTHDDWEACIRIHIKLLISYPEISEAAKRALKFHDDYSQGTYDGLMRIANGDAFLVIVYVLSRWLYMELTQDDMDHYTREVMQELTHRLQFWHAKIPGIDMIRYELKS